MVISMNMPKSNKFVEEVISYVKFPFDREDIKKELQDHMLDKMEDFKSRGIDDVTAEELTIKSMGDPREIGIELNKEHNYILGWIYKITNVLVVILLVWTILSLGVTSLMSIFWSNPINSIPKDNIVYNIKVNEKVKIDDRVVKFKNIVYEKNGDLSIVYENYDTKLWGTGWSSTYIGNVKDNLGNDYFPGSGSSSGGIITRGIRTVHDFPRDAETVIIEYDIYNRYYKVEIPLKAGVSNE